MEFLKLLFHLAIFICLNILANSAEIPEISSRTATCSLMPSNNKQIFKCSGYPSIPNITDTDPTVDKQRIVLDMSSGNTLQVVRTGEFIQAGFFNLDTIKLSHNQIRTIERGAFQGLEILRELDLSYNKIDSLDMEMFEKNEHLHTIYLNHNPIHQFIGEMFPPLPGLNKIDLNNCSIGSIPPNSFSELSNLRELRLDSNQLTRLDWNVFRYSYQLTNVQLHNNPWHCDCHFRFLHEYLTERKIQFTIGNSMNADILCTGPPHFANKRLADIKMHEMTCPPMITKFVPIGSGLVDFASNATVSLTAFATLGKDVSFECSAEAYPEPEVRWLKDGKEIDLNNHGRGLSQDHGDEPHLKIEHKLRRGQGQSGDKYEERFKYRYSTLLSIYKTEIEDFGEYVCQVTSSSGAEVESKGVFLKFSGVDAGGYETSTQSLVTGGSGKVWLWVIIGLLLLLIVVAVVALGIGLWKRRERQRQKVLKQQMMEKFKNSQTILDDNSHTNKPSKNDDAGAPLLSQGNNQLIQIHSQSNSKLPDVAQGKAEHVRNMSPAAHGQDVFSPRPPHSATDLKQQFLNNLDRPSRPESAMSIYSNYGYGAPSLQPSNQRVYGILQPNYYPGRQSQQHQQGSYPIRRLGSAQSLIHPDPTYIAQRPMLMRQFSGPAYATMRHTHDRDRRPPSISSMASEPARPTYVTLPRYFGAPGVGPRIDSGFEPSLSPTESNYSNYSSFSYSTLPRRGPQLRGNGVAYDSVGPRTTADGGSTLSLNRVGEAPNPKMDTLDSINSGLGSPNINKGKIKTPRERIGSSTTPGSLRNRDFFSFEPIQEVEGSADDVMAQLPPESEVDKLFPKIQIQPSIHEVRYKKKKPPPISAIPPRTRKPVRTFEYSKLGESPNPNHSLNSSVISQSIAEDPNETFVDGPTPPPPPPIPSSPIPQDPKTSIENIIEQVEGTEV